MSLSAGQNTVIKGETSYIKKVKEFNINSSLFQKDSLGTKRALYKTGKKLGSFPLPVFCSCLLMRTIVVWIWNVSHVLVAGPPQLGTAGSYALWEVFRLPETCPWWALRDPVCLSLYHFLAMIRRVLLCNTLQPRCDPAGSKQQGWQWTEHSKTVTPNIPLFF